MPIRKLSNKENISFNLKYAINVAIICFIYAVALSPLLFDSSGMLRGLEYLMWTFPASVISYPFLHLFWKLLEEPPDTVIVAATAIIFAIESFFITFIIVNFKFIITYTIKNKKKVLVYCGLISLLLIILSFSLYFISALREDITWKQYAKENSDAEFCKNIINHGIYEKCLIEAVGESSQAAT